MIYWWKDYNQEVDFLTKVLKRYEVRGKRILEVACGTGNHTKILAAKGYEITGVDISDKMLSVARRKVRSHARFLRGDMRDLDAVVDGRYEAAICLFTAISYNLTRSDLKRTIPGLSTTLKQRAPETFTPPSTH